MYPSLARVCKLINDRAPTVNQVLTQLRTVCKIAMALATPVVRATAPAPEVLVVETAMVLVDVIPMTATARVAEEAKTSALAALEETTLARAETAMDLEDLIG